MVPVLSNKTTLSSVIAGGGTNGGKSYFLCIFVSFLMHPLFSYFIFIAVTIFLESIGATCADISPNQQISRLKCSPPSKFEPVDYYKELIFAYVYNPKDVGLQGFTALCLPTTSKPEPTSKSMVLLGVFWVFFFLLFQVLLLGFGL